MKMAHGQAGPRQRKGRRVLLLIGRATGYDRGVLSGIRDFHRIRPDWEFVSFRGREIDRSLLQRHAPDGIIAHQEGKTGVL